jgi:predicted MPP superfamily phosphohydrolase
MESMSIQTASVLYNSMMALFVGVALFWFVQNRGWLRFFSGLFAMASSAVVIAIILSLSQWNPLRAARLLCFGWFVHVPIYLLACALLTKQKLIRWVALSFLVAILSNAAFAFWFEPFRLEVTRFQMASAKISRPIKIGLLADFQTDKFEEYERRALRRLMAEQPDLILMAGDYLQADDQDRWEQLRDQTNAFLQRMSFGAPLGVIGVGGNTDFRRWPEIFRGLSVTSVVDTDTMELEDLVVTGLSVEDSFNPQLSSNHASEKFKIILGHAPDFSLSPDLDADLLVAGHTHGGQVRLPFFGPLVTFSRVPRSWAAGKTQISPRRTLVVSRGVGMERRDAPRLRYLCRPQLVFIELQPAAANEAP